MYLKMPKNYEFSFKILKINIYLGFRNAKSMHGLSEK